VEGGTRTAFVTGGSGFIGGRLIERLTREGVKVRALARSDSSAAKVEALGAEAVRGDLDDENAMRDGAAGCKYAFHAAAKVEDWGDPADFERINVEGTATLLRATKAAGVERFVHVGTEAALLAGNPLVNATEASAPLRPDSPSLYPATKARAERTVRTASRKGFDTMVVRPRMVWGPGDTTVLPGIVEAVEAGKFAFIGGGHHRTSTTHVDNTIEGLILAADHGSAGAAYFVTDGEPIVFREWVAQLLETQGLEAPDKSIPRPVANAVATAAETAWKLLPLKGAPPLTRMTAWVTGLECTLDDSLAREELGYAPVKTREQGLDELRELAGSARRT
jgi:nucleoside-diphosphate-sugar epimerase